MIKLKQMIPAAKLRSFTHLKVKTKNARRWSSTIAMILRYTKIKEFLPRLEINEIDYLVLSAKDVNTFISIEPVESKNCTESGVFDVSIC
jgi:hypothetical protein